MNARPEVSTAEMQGQPSIPTSAGKTKANTNKVLVHSLNEMSIGTANLRGEDGRSGQGTQEQVQRSNMGNTHLLDHEDSSMLIQNQTAR